MKKLAIMLVAFAVVVGGVATPALAGPYFSVNGGAAWVEDSDLSVSGFGNIAEFSYETGYVVNAAFGNAYANGLRLELEIPYRTNDLDEISVLGPSLGTIDGEVSAWGGMINVYYDFDTGSAVKPFIGAGIGIADIELEIEGSSEDDNVFAYQLMAGMGFAISKDVTLDLQYRFYATDDPEFDISDPDNGKVTLESEYMTHNVMLGLRFNF